MERGPEPSPRPPQGAIGVLIPKCPAASITHKTTIFYLLDSDEARRQRGACRGACSPLLQSMITFIAVMNLQFVLHTPRRAVRHRNTKDKGQRTSLKQSKASSVRQGRWSRW